MMTGYFALALRESYGSDGNYAKLVKFDIRFGFIPQKCHMFAVISLCVIMISNTICIFSLFQLFQVSVPFDFHASALWFSAVAIALSISNLSVFARVFGIER
jgi:hypothetical protein